MTRTVRFLIGAILCTATFAAWLPAAGPLRGAATAEGRTPYYLPHMTWDEVAAYLETSDVVIIPNGSVEQHGKHLPLGSDIVTAIESAVRVGQRAHVVVAPVVLAGCSDHHMGFAGTMTLSPETFEAVLFEGARSLIAHGFRKIIFYTGHGGNYVSVANVVQRINQETEALATDLHEIEFPPVEGDPPHIPLDSHAGVEETSIMLELTPGLVAVEKIENPVLTLPPGLRAALDDGTSPNLQAVAQAWLFRPERSGKGTSTRDMTSNGVVTTGDVNSSNAALGRAVMKQRVDAIVRFIEEWRTLEPRPAE